MSLDPDYKEKPLKTEIKSVEYDFPTEIFDLPSQGYSYSEENSLSNGKLRLKYPSTKEEDILTSQNLIKKGIYVDEFLKSIIVDSIDYDSLIIGDKNSLMIAGRILLYGSEYILTDIECSDCGHTANKVNIDLNELTNKELDVKKLNRLNEYEYTLPHSKVKLKFKLLSVKDERAITKEVEKHKRLDKSGKDLTGTIRLKHAIIEINGDDNRNNINNFFEKGKFLSKDSREFKKHFYELSPNIEMKSEYECTQCGAVHQIVVPITTEFFWPST